MKKAWHIIKAILLWLVVALAVCMMGFTIVSVNTFDRMDRSLFGYKAFIVLSDSMSATDFKRRRPDSRQGSRSRHPASGGYPLLSVHQQ